MSENAEAVGAIDTVGVVGDPERTAAVAEAVGETSAEPVVDDAASLAESVDAVVAVGERALLEAVTADPSVPVLPLEAGRGVRSVSRNDVGAALADLVAGRWEPVDHPLLAAETPHGRVRALMDLMLVTDEPARISEYSVESGDTHVGTFRADAVVVATPAGSTGYARSADGPVIAPGSGVAAVVPVAPFATATDDWVLPIDDLRLRVEREETPVVLLADDREIGEIPAHESLRVRTDGALTVATVGVSRPFY